MEAVFRLMDADGSGQLSLGEFRKACDVLNECSTGNEHHSPPQSPERSRAVGGGKRRRPRERDGTLARPARKP
jgi:hypothetical protein